MNQVLSPALHTRSIKIIRKTLSPTLVAMFVLIILASPAYSQQQPNIIYIMTDDMGYGDLSSYGQTNYKTPNLDKLASQGMKFTNAYAAASLCTPTRAAFMTGRYPARTPVGLIEPLTGNKGDIEMGLTPEYPSIATHMKKAGYQTMLVGKWHLGALLKHSPSQNGFDYFFGFRHGASDYISHRVEGQPDLYENDTPVSRPGYLTDLLTEKTIELLSKKHSKPFFLTLMYNAPHWPWQGPSDKAYPDSIDFREGGSAQIYAEMMKSLDNSIGKIMQTLEDAKLTQNTIVIFTNDNGGERYSSHGGLSKSKANLWEGGIRVPAFVRWPEKIKPGATTQQVAITMDWTATILTIAGAKSLFEFPLDGIDLTPVLTGKKKSIDRTLYWRMAQRTKQQAIRMGDWKYLQDPGGEYLFNVGSDQAEKTNLKEANPKIFNDLKNKFAAWEKTVLPPISL